MIKKETESKKYASFWLSLKHGQAQEGEFARVVSSGEVKYYEMYSPVRNCKGKVYKTVGITLDLV